MDREQAIETLQACIRGCVRRESREPRTPFPFARDSDLLTGVLTWLQAQVPTQNNHPVKVPAVPNRPVFDHTRPEGLGVLAQPKFAFGHIPSEHQCEHCREYDLDGCPNCPGFQEY